MKMRSAWRDAFGDYWTNEEYNAAKNAPAIADVDLSKFERVFIMTPFNFNEPKCMRSTFFPPF